MKHGWHGVVIPKLGWTHITRRCATIHTNQVLQIFKLNCFNSLCRVSALGTTVLFYCKRNSLSVPNKSTSTTLKLICIKTLYFCMKRRNTAFDSLCKPETAGSWEPSGCFRTKELRGVMTNNTEMFKFVLLSNADHLSILVNLKYMGKHSFMELQFSDVWYTG
jgi:hypothetical protein